MKEQIEKYKKLLKKGNISKEHKRSLKEKIKALEDNKTVLK